MKKKTNAAPLSSKAVDQLVQLRQTMTLEAIAAAIPCSSRTAWKASAGGELAPSTRFLFEYRLNELTSGNVAQVGTNAAA